ncbi:hypothetical protein GCM10027059_25830 [Myceligenerans halotolerans]
MSNPEHIHLALAALAPVPHPFHDDEAPGNAVAPWLVGSLSMPDNIEGGAGSSHGGVARWWVTVAALTAGQARVIGEEARLAWSGARVAVAGYSLGVVVHRYSTGPYRAGLTATDTDLRYQVARLGFDLTISRIP